MPFSRCTTACHISPGLLVLGIEHQMTEMTTKPMPLTVFTCNALMCTCLISFCVLAQVLNIGARKATAAVTTDQPAGSKAVMKSAPTTEDSKKVLFTALHSSQAISE